MVDKDKDEGQEVEIWHLLQIEQQMIVALKQCVQPASARSCIQSFSSYLIAKTIEIEKERKLEAQELEILLESTSWENNYFGGLRNE